MRFLGCGFLILLCLSALVVKPAAANHKDVVILKSYNSFDDTLARLETGITDLGLTLFAKIDHQEGARNIREDLGPAVVILFGHPKAGTPLMQRNLFVGLDLPLKILVSENKGLVQITYREPMSLAEIWHLGPPVPVQIKGMAKTLRSLADQASRKQE